MKHSCVIYLLTNNLLLNENAYYSVFVQFQRIDKPCAIMLDVKYSSIESNILHRCLSSYCRAQC